MRLGTVDTGCRQARNARPPRQLRSLALIAVFLLSACGGSETSSDNSINPEGLTQRKAGLSTLLRGGVSFAAGSAGQSPGAGSWPARPLCGGQCARGAVPEGDIWARADLAGTLGAIRRRGGVDFFQGALARLLSDQVAQMGGSLPLEALRNALPITGAPAGESYGGFRVYVAPAPMAGANALAGWHGQPAPAAGVPTDSGGFSGFAAIDEKGGAAACTLSMGQLFGTRMIVPGTGVMLGAVTADAASVSPLVIGNPGNGEVRVSGAGGGSPYATFATGAIAPAKGERKQPVQSALDAHGGPGGTVDAIP